MERHWKLPDNYDDFHVFIWTFKKCIPCSDTKKDHFMFKELRENSGKPDSKTDGKIGYPYFTLEQGMEPDDTDVYFAASQRDRVNAFSLSLQRHKFYVQQAGGDLSHYCEFSGGGDIYIENEVEEPFIFQSADLDTATNLSPIKDKT